MMSNIICFLYRSVFKMTAEDVVFLSSPLTFDPSVVEMFLALSSGASLLIVPSAVKKMPRRLAHVLFKRNTTTVLQAREYTHHSIVSVRDSNLISSLY